MVADSDHLSIPARRLAERLRDLREREYEQLTQKQLAKALGGARTLSIATISHWEKPGSGRLPSPARLGAYARLFCTRRSFTSEAPRLLRDEELTQHERDREAELYDELLSLRERAQSTDTPAPPVPAPGQPDVQHRSSIWHFPDKKAVSIVCSATPDPPSFASPGHLNFSRYARHADLDALIEVFGQVRADNPVTMTRILLTAELTQDFALNHLVIVGGAAVYDTAPYFAPDIPLPRAEPIPGTETHVFNCRVGDEAREFTSSRDSEGALVEDVGLIARGPHPFVDGRTVTMLSGITSRGVYGAALCFTDSHVRVTNEQYLEDTFGPSEAFCLLINISVRNDEALPPNLQRDGIRLYEWSTGTGARW